ncbi:hypothetical protein LAG90_00415 [Marinilongibacter aquaticus]|uniref:hypothetical protein n=1 Tax=Marinilongibacter aquaticus TaxID=2975157 RepID=UPI0021BD9773|nr:hypothetical protein [Marinilongibacter aquaticus]UBM59121.1 hypothetical protein LAG90_00415 [Marinilongibacter aquaticus]
MNRIFTLLLILFAQVAFAQTSDSTNAVTDTTQIAVSDSTQIAISDSVQAAADSVNALLSVDFPAYKMTVPYLWRIKPGCVEGQCTFISRPDTLLDFDSYIESINLTVNKLNNSGYTALKYADFSIGYLPKVVKGFKLLEKKKIGSNAYRITYMGTKNSLKQTWRQYYYVKSGKVYIVTFSAETRKYEFYQPMIEPFLNSFALK